MSNSAIFGIYAAKNGFFHIQIQNRPVVSNSSFTIGEKKVVNYHIADKMRYKLSFSDHTFIVCKNMANLAKFD